MERRLFASASLLLVLTVSCNGRPTTGPGPIVTGLANAPTMSVLVSTSAAHVADGVAIPSFSFPQDISYVQSRVEGEGGLTRSDRARPITPPAIAANRDFYVLAFWGGPPNFTSINLFASENGRDWSRAGSHSLVGTGQVGAASRPSITYFPGTGTWFLIFRDDSDGSIQLVQFRIQCVGAPGGGCATDSRGITRYESSMVNGPGPPANTGLTTVRPPSIGILDAKLIIAFAPAHSSALKMVTSSDGGAFSTPVTAMVGGSSIECEGAPYLHNAPTGLYVAACSQNGSTADIDVYSSASPDGANWTLSKTLSSVGNFLTYGAIDPAIAGPESEMLIAYRTHGQVGTTVQVGSNTYQLSTDTSRSVGLAYGPGPTKTVRMTCAAVSPLIARGSQGDSNVIANRSVEVDTNGDITMICAQFSAQAGCASNTRSVVVRRGGGDTFTVECWKR